MFQSILKSGTASYKYSIQKKQKDNYFHTGSGWMEDISFFHRSDCEGQRGTLIPISNWWVEETWLSYLSGKYVGGRQMVFHIFHTSGIVKLNLSN